MATIHDLIEVTAIAAHTTYSAAAGNLLGVVDNVSSSALDDGEYDRGDPIVIGGVTYRIDRIQEPASSGRFTQGDGTNRSFDPGSESNLSAVFLTVSNGVEVRHFIVPNDSYGDMKVQEIRTGELQDVAGSDAAVNSIRNNAVNVVCFVAGTRIETPGGDVAVEHLRPGDLVTTRDNGPQALRAMLVRDLDFATAPDRLKPIAFEKGALGAGLPARRLCVSPQHRILLTTASGEEVLVPAKALTGRPGVRAMKGRRRVRYLHMVFNRHEIVRAEGVPTKSLFPGPMALLALPADSRRMLIDIFGEAALHGADAGATMAAPMLKVRDALHRSPGLRASLPPRPVASRETSP